jgi:hypothetical protein
LIVEADDVPKPKQLAILFHLAKSFPVPLHLIVDSLGRSYQGWFHIRNVKQEQWVAMFKEAVRLGADRNMYHDWIKCRMPLGWNKNKKAIQPIVYMSDWIRDKLQYQP